MKSSKFTVALLILLGAGKAHGSTEINGLFDARSAGMGGTGVAFLDSAAAVPTNPAMLDQVNKFTATLDLFYIVSQPIAPYTVYHLDAAGNRYQAYDTIRSSTTGAVLPFIGGAFRLPGVLNRLVFGAAAYPIIGQGTSAKYHSNPDELPNLEVTNKASNGFYEIGNALSVRILDNLSFGATWRITYMTESVTTAVAGGPPAGVILDMNHNPLYGNLDVDGWNFGGYQLGLLYKPLAFLRLGFSYRSKVVVHADGKTKTENPLTGAPLELDTSTSFTYPHAFRGGVAVSLLQDKLLLAAEFKYLMYADAFKTLTTTVVNNGVPSDNVRSLYWRDSAVLLLGAEYRAGIFRPRAGFIALNSATNPAYAVQFMAPPGNSYLGSIGLGLDVMEHLSIDIAAAYVVLESHIYTATVDNSGIGWYASHSGEFSLSGTYHM